MIEQEKRLLLQDLCARLPYKVKVEIVSYGQETLKPWFGELSCKDLQCFMVDVAYKSVKPFLRSMSSMTEEEEKEYRKTQITKWIKSVDCACGGYYDHRDTLKTFDWLNANHFDYRGLIKKGLAIEVTEDNNPYKS